MGEGNMDIEFYCNVCAKSWSYHDVSMPQAELINQWYEAHTHTREELATYFESEAGAVRIQDDTDD